MKGFVDIITLILVAGGFTIGSIFMLYIHEAKLETGVGNFYNANGNKAALYSLLNSKSDGRTIQELISEYEINDPSSLIKQKLDIIFGEGCYKLVLGENKILAQSSQACDFKYQSSFIIPLPGNRVENLELLT